MLAGLIFATEDADDRVGTLAATLPFGGLTLIEFQARLLIAAGASQIILVIARLTPELLGAINRIGRRGVPVDTVRSAVDVVEKLHPLARVLVIADGLVTSGDVISMLRAEDRDSLLVTDDGDEDFERVGGRIAWAGLALLDPRHIVDVAGMPRDYDFQSTLLRVAAQANAVHIPLPAGAAGGVHGIERDSVRLAERGRAILTSLIPTPTPWADRYLLAPAVRLVLPRLIARSVRGTAMAVVAGVPLAAAFSLFWFRWPGAGPALAAGLILLLVAMGCLSAAATISVIRDEVHAARLQRAAISAAAAGSALLIGLGSAAGWIAAGAAIIAAGLAARAGDSRTWRRWSASPAAYPVVMLPFAAAGWPVACLVVAAGYAALTLGGAIEALRKKS